VADHRDAREMSQNAMLQRSTRAQMNFASGTDETGGKHRAEDDQANAANARTDDNSENQK